METEEKGIKQTPKKQLKSADRDSRGVSAEGG